MKFTPATVQTLRAELAAAAHGETGAVARRLSALYGVSTSTLYRAAGLRGTPRPRAKRHPEYRDWTRTAVEYAHAAPKPVPLDVVLDALVEGGVLPPEAAHMPVATARRIARNEFGLSVRTKRHHRLHASYPMQAVQVDGSTSEFLMVRRLDGDDPLLALHRRPWSAGGYKNKPLGEHRMRVIVYAMWDMCTGYALARYVVAKGENAVDVAEFVCWGLGEDKDPRLVLHGVPDDLWSDQGVLFKSGPSRDLLDRLDIHLVVGEAYAKERMGGVERSHRTRWSRFERALFMRGADEIRLSELNARLVEYTIRENARRQSRTLVDGRLMSRTDAWLALTRTREVPLRKLPADPIRTMAFEADRWIDATGIIRWDTVEYEVEGDWNRRWVLARRAMDGSGDLTVEDRASGERRAAHGEALRGAPLRRDSGSVEAAERAAARDGSPGGRCRRMGTRRCGESRPHPQSHERPGRAAGQPARRRALPRSRRGDARVAGGVHGAADRARACPGGRAHRRGRARQGVRARARPRADRFIPTHEEEIRMSIFAIREHFGLALDPWGQLADIDTADGLRVGMMVRAATRGKAFVSILGRCGSFAIREHFGLALDPWGQLADIDTADGLRVGMMVRAATRGKAFVSILGRCGSGKTRSVWRALGAETAHVVEPCRLDRERLHMGDIQAALVRELSDETPRQSGEARSHQVRRVLGTASRERSVVLVIDDAHLLHHQTLRGLKRLREMSWMGEAPLLGVVLMGQRDRTDGLDEVRLRSDRFWLGGLRPVEARQAIDAVLGGLIEPDAAQRLARSPAVRNWLELRRVVDDCLTEAASREQSTITADTVERVVGKEAPSLDPRANEQAVVAFRGAEK